MTIERWRNWYPDTSTNGKRCLEKLSLNKYQPENPGTMPLTKENFVPRKG